MDKDPLVSQMQQYLSGKGYQAPQQTFTGDNWYGRLKDSMNPTPSPNNQEEGGYFSNVAKSVSGLPGKLVSDVSAGAQDIEQGNYLKGIAKSGFRTAGDVAGTIFSPITEAFSSVLGGINKAFPEAGEAVKSAIDSISDKISNSKELQDWAVKHPNAGEDLGRAMNLIYAGLGSGKGGEIKEGIGNVAGKIKEGVSNVTEKTGNVAGNVVGKVGETAGNLINKVRGKESITGEPIFDTKLTNAYESIYGKLTPAEKASVQLKDVGGGFTKKSVPDFVNDPKTRPVVESVSNLPHELQINPKETLAQTESKLNEGIRRLHNGTEGALLDPKIKTSTGFTDATFSSHMQKNILNPLKSELGANSLEYKYAEKAIKVAKQSIESNDAHGVYIGRQKFNALWEKNNPAMFSKAKGSFGSQLDPRASASVEAGRMVYRELNNFNEKILPENHPLRFRMKEESNLIRAKEEMRTRRSGELDKSNTERFLKRHPTIKAVGKTVGKAAGFGLGIDIAGHL